jgi:hypothetical protein
MSDDQQGLSAEELGSEGATALPDKEVVSILDLNADVNLAVDAAAPIDLAVAANANVAAPIDAAVGANILSIDSSAQALSDQGVIINQGLDADANAHATQDSALDQGNDTVGTDPAATDPAATAGATAGAADTGLDPVLGGAGDAVGGATAGTVGDAAGGLGDVGVGDVGNTASGALDGDLLNVDVNVDADADVAAPINGAVAANANVAAPIDAAVGANVGSVNSDAVAVSQQDAVINQDITGEANATSDQQSDIQQ